MMANQIMSSQMVRYLSVSRQLFVLVCRPRDQVSERKDLAYPSEAFLCSGQELLFVPLGQEESRSQGRVSMQVSHQMEPMSRLFMHSV